MKMYCALNITETINSVIMTARYSKILGLTGGGNVGVKGAGTFLEVRE